MNMASIAFAATSTTLTFQEVKQHSSISSLTPLSFNPKKPFSFTCIKTLSIYPLLLHSKPLTVVSPVATKRERTRSKRYLDTQKYVEINHEYDVKTAVSLLKQTASSKFVESAEAHFRLNINPKYKDQELKAGVNLPKGTGMNVRISVLAQGEKFDEAKSAGADIVGGEDLIVQIKGGFMDFDKLIASQEIMPKVLALGNILGPRGLMPNPKSDKTGIVHIPFGKADLSEEDLIINLNAAVKSVQMNKPTGVKGVYWKSAYSIRLNLRDMLKSLGYTLS